MIDFTAYTAEMFLKTLRSGSVQGECSIANYGFPSQNTDLVRNVYILWRKRSA